MRTRNTLQSLGISRRTILLKNLIQANLLRKELKGELSMLYQANVSGIQFDQLFIHHVSVRNCSMLGMQLQNSSLSHVDLTGCIDFDPEQIHSWVKIDQVTLPNGTTLHAYV
ncbi:unnamed protein product [Adineta ricciae]|uniref:Uncharacterized protein n=1 Tax=Adineta ricciae TaxID=249248 RepID=A0A815YMQ1_ADIRI|nr:unnamed protein product [Adineta ricciae]